jgi:nitroimidazol reductase NimA-like FMN-containing flavoprotein (pyridoxamine 5'-phosphate oxidase superfamily)
MSLAMTVPEREAYFAEAHVAVVSVADDGARAPLAVPIWYGYRPGGEISLITARDRRKTALIRAAGRVTLAVQDGDPASYRYASAEGPVTAIEESVTIEQRRELAVRYLGPELADRYIEDNRGITAQMVRILVRPEHWLTRDYTKALPGR